MGEGEPAPAPAADIKIFISGSSGSKEVKRAQLVRWALFKRERQQGYNIIRCNLFFG